MTKFIVNLEHYITYTKYYVSFASKLIISLFINTAVVTSLVGIVYTSKFTFFIKKKISMEEGD